MAFKTEAKERFTEIYLGPVDVDDNLAAQLVEESREWLIGPVKNLIVSLDGIRSLENGAATKLILLQQEFYEANASLVFCCMTKEIENQLEEMELLEVMNFAPTLSEAWDILQMEEIERELLDDDHPEFSQHN